MEFYIQIDCANCDAEIMQGINITLLEHNGRPVILASAAEQIRVTCDECGATTVTGELEVLNEGAL